MTNEELTKKYVEIDETVARHSEQLRTCFNQIAEAKDMTESVRKLATTVEILVHEQKDTAKKVDRLTGEIEEIKEKPARRWDSVVTVVVTAIATAIVTYALTQIGLK